jgi:hypothetical protein
MASNLEGSSTENGVAVPKRWSRPVLRKLPIAATAGSQGKPFIIGDDGNCGGKGDAAACLS